MSCYQESKTVAGCRQAGTCLPAGLVVSLWCCQATKGPGLWDRLQPAGQPAQTSTCPFDPQSLESSPPQTRTCGGDKIHGQLSNVRSDFEGWGWGDLYPSGEGVASGFPRLRDEPSLLLSLRSALGEERAAKNSMTDLNTSAPCRLQVRSNYSADKRLLAQGAWHPRCPSRGLDAMGPQSLLLLVGI